MTYRSLKLAVVAAAVVLTVACPLLTSTASEVEMEAGPQRRARQPRRRAPAPAQRPPRVAYTEFSHNNPAHQGSCDSCHKFPSANWKAARAGDEAFPDITDYPTHSACLDCHRQQFFARERPAPRICSVCHVGVTPRDTARHPFPNPAETFRESERARAFVSAFRIFFPHEKHLGLFGGVPEGVPATGDREARMLPVALGRQDAAAASGTCATCHQTYQPQGDSADAYATKPPEDLGDRFWLKRGTFKTSPDSHASCFTCHSADSGLKPAPTDCATCHRLAPAAPARTDFDPKAAAAMNVVDPVILEAWRRRNSSATFPHEGGLHADISCTTCHDVAGMDTADDRTTKVLILSCAGEMGCHITATSDEGGALNFELDQRSAKPAFTCVKCHIGYGNDPVPPSHPAAVPKPKTD
jgi:hypothetical protein